MEKYKHYDYQHDEKYYNACDGIKSYEFLKKKLQSYEEKKGIWGK